jgi:hypothetical protein
MKILVNRDFSTWTPELQAFEQQDLAHQLESGRVLFFPALPFELKDTEKNWIQTETQTQTQTPDMSAKNISFNPKTSKIKGIKANPESEPLLENLCKRFHQQATQLIHHLLPNYQNALQIGMTTFRPVEVEGRIPDSYKKDDTRLHVDAFPSRPNQGRRILRVFSNINPHQKPRVWKVGEPFQQVAESFFPRVKPPIPGSAFLMKTLKITKSARTHYDHAMLQIHHQMKADLVYQKKVPYEQIDFPAGSTWVVFSDSVSHAVLSGQHMMEQTFYLPAHQMQDPALSPLHILNKLAGRELA